jgi:hypothetical protein
MAKHLSKIMSQTMKHGIIATLYKQKYSNIQARKLILSLIKTENTAVKVMPALLRDSAARRLQKEE